MMQCTRVAIVLLASLPLAAQSGWVQRSPAHVPPVRAWHGLSYDLFHDVHVLFGGGSTGAMLGDTWQWNGIDWQQIAPTRSPPARCCHAMAYDVSLGCVVLHGGRDNAGIVLDDTWQFDGANWVQQAPAQTPGARQTAGMAFSFARFHTILFGGNGGTPLAPRNDTWEWNGSNWSQVVTAHRPPPRSAFAITSDIVQGRVVLFGGLSGTDLSDLWSFDGFDWSALPHRRRAPRGATPRWPPTRRVACSCSSVDSRSPRARRRRTRRGCTTAAIGALTCGPTRRSRGALST